MSNWYEKIEYECHCGQDYGTCEKIGRFFLKYQGVSDTYVLFEQAHESEPVRVLGYFDDDSLKALGILLNRSGAEMEGCTSEEIAAMKQAEHRR